MSSSSVAAPVEDIQKDGRWMSQHTRHVENCQLKKPQVLFVGDSLIARFEDTETWENTFAPMNCLNAGISGDSTQHVLWRLENGLLSSCSPKLVVVLVGTNNHNHTADEVVEGIEAIAWCINNNVPTCTTLVLGMLPRGERPNELREKMYRINHALKEVVGVVPSTYYLDADPGFVRADKSIAHEDMNDFLHMSRRGYVRFGAVVAGMVKRLLAAAPAS